jgi:hypothetical protein
MNMMLLTGLSVALALSVMTSNNFYADKVTTASINDFNKQINSEMSYVINKTTRYKQMGNVE